jgi:hypothetical protein
VPGRHFHFAFEFADETPIDGVASPLVTSLLCHAGLSTEHAAAMAADVMTAVRSTGTAPCRVEVDGGVDEVQIVVTRGGVPAWRGTREVE